MAKKLTLLGSTGSIGTQSLDVARAQGYEVYALAANSNVDLLLKQIEESHPAYVAVANPDACDQLAARLGGVAGAPKLLRGAEGIVELAKMEGPDVVLNAVVGIAGLGATLAALENGHDVALANKESLVTGGHLVTEAAAKHGTKLLPVDSEHSAIFQCLQDAHSAKTLTKILLTASGGPFFGMKKEKLAGKTRADALKHPNWNMGAKITIDSATLMNKGLEVIEAVHLFGVTPDRIEVLVHRESIVHSMVEFDDYAVLGQFGVPDMKIPIQLALTYPDRLPCPTGRLDLAAIGKLTFARPDLDTFLCLRAALTAIGRGGLYPALLNAVNEQLVARFLAGKLPFLAIGDLAMESLNLSVPGPVTLSGIEEAEALAEDFVRAHT